jgi:hypothetical protein
MVFAQCDNRSLHLAGQCRKVVEHEPALLSWNHHRCVELKLLVEVHLSFERATFGVEQVSTGSDTELFWPIDHLMSLK